MVWLNFRIAMCFIVCLTGIQTGILVLVLFLPKLIYLLHSCIWEFLDRSSNRRGSNVWDYSRESSASLLSLLRDCGVIDIWRSLHPSTIALSWLKPDGMLSSRIDFNWTPLPLDQFCTILRVHVLACPYSDHCAVVLSVPIPESIPRGPGRWKLNIPFLKDDNFRSSVSNFWAGWCCLVLLLRYRCYPFMPMTVLSSPHRMFHVGYLKYVFCSSVK